MKKLRNTLMLLLCAIVAMSALSSCLDDNSTDSTITPEMYKTYLTTMSGTYSGRLRFYVQKPYSQQYEKYDSAYSAWQVATDSTVTLRQFPINKLDSAISVSESDKSENATQVRALRAALSKAEPTDLKSFFYIPSSNFVGESAIQFYVNPLALEVPLTYNGQTHKVYFVFTSNYCGGVYGRTQRTFEYFMQLYGICVDKASESNKISSMYVKNVQITCTTK